MANLMYVANVSLDGFVEDERGGIGWTEPSDEVFSFFTELVRPVGTYLYGRRMYETMRVWETNPALAAQSRAYSDFATVWRGADKVVFSTELASVATSRTRIERRFDVRGVRRIKESARRDLTVGGAALAGEAFDAALVDEIHLVIYPIVLGTGKPAFRNRGRTRLDLVEERSFDGGATYLRYRVLH